MILEQNMLSIKILFETKQPLFEASFSRDLLFSNYLGAILNGTLRVVNRTRRDIGINLCLNCKKE